MTAGGGLTNRGLVLQRFCFDEEGFPPLHSLRQCVDGVTVGQNGLFGPFLVGIKIGVREQRFLLVPGFLQLFDLPLDRSNLGGHLPASPLPLLPPPSLFLLPQAMLRRR